MVRKAKECSVLFGFLFLNGKIFIMEGHYIWLVV